MIILISPYKFTEFSFINYEIDIYKKKLKHKIEIHDLSNLINPTWNDAFKLKKYKKSKIFKSINDWENHLIKLKDSEKKIIVINELVTMLFWVAGVLDVFCTCGKSSA